MSDAAREPAVVPIMPWPATDEFPPPPIFCCDTAPPTRCAFVRSFFLSPAVGFTNALALLPALTVLQSCPPKPDMVVCVCAVLACVRYSELHAIAGRLRLDEEQFR